MFWVKYNKLEAIYKSFTNTTSEDKKKVYKARLNFIIKEVIDITKQDSVLESISRKGNKLTLEELIDEIYRSGVSAVEVTRHSVKHGNKNQAEDHSTVMLIINDRTYIFSNQTGSWVRQ